MSSEAVGLLRGLHADELNGDEQKRATIVQTTTPDDALRAAIKVAVDAGDLDRVRALIAVLEASGSTSEARTTLGNVVPFASRKAK